MTKNRTKLFSLLVLAITVNYLFITETEILNLALATTLLIFEIITFKTFEHKRKSLKNFQLKSFDWISGIAFSVLMILIFSDSEMNIRNALAMVFIATFGVLVTIRNRTKVYTYDIDGLTYLNENKHIKSELITKVNLLDDLISIDSKNFRNELSIRAKDLKSPKWSVVKIELEEIGKTWANNG